MTTFNYKVKVLLLCCVIVLIRGNYSRMLIPQAEDNEFVRTNDNNNNSSNNNSYNNNNNNNNNNDRIDPFRDAILSRKPNASMEELINREESYICPELMAASRFYINSYREEEPGTSPSLRIALVQLIGQWRIPAVRTMMNKLHQHNAKIAKNHGMDTISITSPAKPTNATPAFWKMVAVHEICATSKYDIVWFIDGDVLITLPNLPVEALWIFHRTYNPEMDILFSLDFNFINSGMWMINCTSTTALEFLQLWDQQAESIAKKVDVSWGEQFWLHYVFHSPHFYQKENASSVPIWNDTVWAKEQPEKYSLQVISKRIRTTFSQCSMTRYPVGIYGELSSRKDNPSAVPHQPGDISVHTASLTQIKRLVYFTQTLAKINSMTVFDTNGGTTTQTALVAAEQYIRLHATSFKKKCFDREKSLCIVTKRRKCIHEEDAWKECKTSTSTRQVLAK